MCSKSRALYNSTRGSGPLNKKHCSKCVSYAEVVLPLSPHTPSGKHTVPSFRNTMETDGRCLTAVAQLPTAQLVRPFKKPRGKSSPSDQTMTRPVMPSSEFLFHKSGHPKTFALHFPPHLSHTDTETQTGTVPMPSPIQISLSLFLSIFLYLPSPTQKKIKVSSKQGDTRGIR